MNKKQAFGGSIEVKFGDRDLKLTLDMNALAELEEATGHNCLADQFWLQFLSSINAKKLRLLFWAMTRTHHPDITIEQMGSMLSMENQDELLRTVEFAQTAALGNENVKKNSSAQPDAKARKGKPGSTGSNSGPRAGSASASPTKSSGG